MKSAILSSVPTIVMQPAGAVCRACGVDCTAEATGRPRRYPSDLRDSEWALIASLLPVPAADTPRGGRAEVHCRRAIIDAIFYVADNGCKWRALPVDFPPRSTVHGCFTRWREQGVWDGMNDVLRDRERMRQGRKAEPTAAVIDSQSVRAAETVGKGSRGWDNAKKVGGRKRHIAVDVLGLLLVVHVTAASAQDRDAAFFLLQRLRLLYGKITLVWADSGYDYGRLIDGARRILRLTVQVVRRTDDVTGFVVLPRRWVVERTLSWICQRRRCVRDYERLPGNHEAMVTISMIMLMTRRLARPRTALPHAA
ncbi:MAG TPA: IS5 family transposase [Actinocrinis sp.]|uniref:IS5 family transposase n=1 Tax=Actinocrinis sp. TaxID=1920516 RepID=UPI002DDD79AB|nr:IS5 family transposase [Actinocrinis sp.]HEV2345376.1 IS5 family transposase [Actinocrinis sp.]